MTGAAGGGCGAEDRVAGALVAHEPRFFTLFEKRQDPSVIMVSLAIIWLSYTPIHLHITHPHIYITFSPYSRTTKITLTKLTSSYERR